jgi:hypothetical protein
MNFLASILPVPHIFDPRGVSCGDDFVALLDLKIEGS